MNACACAEHAETFTELVTSLAHWELELFIMVLVDGLALGLAWPFLKKHFRHHLAHDIAHPETTSSVCSICHQPDRAGGHPKCAEISRLLIKHLNPEYVATAGRKINGRLPDIDVDDE